uniref:Glycosyltransferase RgtA/B/C/D-like domain-containing protein n=1 Tax=candidate division WOR-3 bacterium TaxID=2052148 RepID=A0A7C4CC98_UNCW3
MQKADESTSLRGGLPFAALLLALGLGLHLWRLGHWTPLPDEVNYGLSARYLIEHRTLVGHDIMFFPPLFVYLAALLQLAGTELLTSVRLISAVSGALVLPVLYVALRGLYGERTARLASLAALPLSSLHLYSRLGQVEVPALALVAGGICLLLQLVQTDQRRYAFWSGLMLGFALWVKETALGAAATAVLFLLATKPRRGRNFALLAAGWLIPAAPLILLGVATGNDLFFEVSASRGYDINMLKLSPLTNLLTTGANMGYNLFPRLFYRWEFILFAVAAPLTLLALGWQTMRGALQRHLFPLFVTSYLVVHLPFFILFSRKFDYYLLPAALLLLVGGSAEALAASTRDARRGFTDRVVVPACLVLTVLLVGFNIYSCRFLYWNRGTHRTFADAVRAVRPGSGLATSHPSLARYINDRGGLGLNVTPLFKKGSYEVAWSSATSPAVTTLLMKRNYFDALVEQPARPLDSLMSLFPKTQVTADPDWSIWLALEAETQKTGASRIVRRLRHAFRPVGVVALRR